MDVQTSVIGIDTLVGTAVSQPLIDSETPLPEGRVAASVLCAGTQVGACTAETLQDAVRVSGNLTLLLLCESPSGEAFGFSAASTLSTTSSWPARRKAWRPRPARRSWNAAARRRPASST